MLSNIEFVRQSLELNLFFMRIAKEHAIFLEASFGFKDQLLAQQAESFKCEFTTLLEEAICLSPGIISPQVLASGELFTKYTINAEQATQFYSGIQIDTNLSRRETSLYENLSLNISSELVEQVSLLNQKAITATIALAQYKNNLLQAVQSCHIFTFNYPLLIDHILREAKFYLKQLYRLQNREIFNLKSEMQSLDIFWSRIMAEHAKFIRGLLDPSEEGLFDIAHNFGKEFDELSKQAIALNNQTTRLHALHLRALDSTTRIRDFKVAGTEGLLQCKIKALAMPLLGDHVVREANHYLRLLNTFISKNPQTD